MPIYIHGRQAFCTPQEALSILQQATDSFGTFYNLDAILYHMAYYSRKKHAMMPEFHQLMHGPIEPTQREKVLYAFLNYYGIPENKLTSRDGKLTLSAKVVEPLLDDPTLTDTQRYVLDVYMRVRKCSTMISYLGQYAVLPQSQSLDAEGYRMVIAHPRWSMLATKRFSASEPSAQNMNHDIYDIYTAPAGWQLVKSDTGQVEPRITYSAYIHDDLIVNLITLYDDAYFGLLHYILMSAGEEAMARANFSVVEKHEITDEMKAMRKRLKVLGLAGNYGSKNLGAVDAELGPLYEAKIVNHPIRRQLEAQVAANVRAGQTIFKGYFGTEIDPSEAKRDASGMSTKSWRDHIVRCGINNPIQATAAELMHMSIKEASRILGPDNHIAAWVHDAGMFYVKDDQVKEMAPKLQECLAYRVDGWIPINSDLSIGREKSPHVDRIY